MNAGANAIAVGARRGLTEYRISLRTPSEVVFTAIAIVIAGVVLFLNRDVELVPGVPASGFILASILTVQLLFVATYGLATAITTDREFGVLLRARSLPFGLVVYSVGSLMRTIAELLVTVVLTLLVAAVVLGAALDVDPVGVGVVLAMTVLGLVALAGVGFAVGAAFRSPRAVGGWGLLVAGALVWVSGLVQPLATMPAWAQVVGQATPLYWIGLAFRSAFLPEAFDAIEIGGSWRLPLAFAVAAAWAIVAVVAAPVLLRRAARRENAALMETRRAAALHRV